MYTNEHLSPQNKNNDLTRYESMQYNDPGQQYYPVDIPMQNQHQHQLPLDRIAEYRKNPPTEGVSLFSHRVSARSFSILTLLSY